MNAAEIKKQLSTEELEDLEHFVNTNQIPILSMTRWRELGLSDDKAKPTALAAEVVELD